MSDERTKLATLKDEVRQWTDGVGDHTYRASVWDEIRRMESALPMTAPDKPARDWTTDELLQNLRAMAGFNHAGWTTCRAAEEIERLRDALRQVEANAERTDCMADTLLVGCAMIARKARTP